MIGNAIDRIAAAARRLPRWTVFALAGLGAAALVAVGIALALTSSPAYFSSYHRLERSVTTLEASGHVGLDCDQCHPDSRGAAVYRAALVGDFYAGIVRKGNEPRFVQMAKPTREACLKCHAEDWSDDAKKTMKVPHPAHLRVIEEKRDCVMCHKWTAHEEEYMEKHKQMPFSTVCASFPCHVGTKQKEDCGTCHHVLQEDKGKWREIHPETVRSHGPGACLESCHDADQCRLCHTTGKTPKFDATVAQAGVRAIEREHVKKDWIAQHGTMALKDETKCYTCHVSVGECEDCHAVRPAFHGLKSTWLGQHKKLAKKVDNPRCLTCHEERWCEDCHQQFKEMR
ncbi:MAG: hypothetical protein HY876_02315 [Coriobacteriales bacterium]|nr:hypothetical protein [Coriobacteriales bacterium]